MIKFVMTNPETGRKLLGIVLEKGNIKYLQKDKPIHISAEEMNLPELKFNEIVISYFETQKLAIEFFKKQGFITSETVIHRIKDEIQ